MSDLKKEFNFYLENKADFLKKYGGKFIVIKDQKIIGEYIDRIQAIEMSRKHHALGSFLVQHVTETEGDEVRFHSRFAV